MLKNKDNKLKRKLDGLLKILENDFESGIELLLTIINKGLENHGIPYSLQKATRPVENVNKKKMINKKLEVNGTSKNACSICQKTYRKRSSLVAHSQNHPGFCHLCGMQRGFEIKQMIEHNTTHHAETYPFVCNKCGECFQRNQQFQIHLLRHIETHAKYLCTVCKVKFRSLKLLKKHITDTKHLGNEPHFCEKCGKNSDDLAKFKHKCHVKPKTCEHCSKSFARRSNLLRHMREHLNSEKRFVCEKCGAMYYSKHALKEHLMVGHAQMEMVQRFQCSICEKSFLLKRLLHRHTLQMHSEKRDFKCNLCEKSYKLKSHLDRHQKQAHKVLKKQNRIEKFTLNSMGQKVLAPLLPSRNEKFKIPQLFDKETQPELITIDFENIAHATQDLVVQRNEKTLMQRNEVIHFLMN